MKLTTLGVAIVLSIVFWIAALKGLACLINGQ